MSCQQCHEWLMDDLRGELDEDRRGRLASHLDSCPACRAEAARVRESWDLLENLPEEKPPAAMRARFEAMLSGAGAAPAANRTWRARGARAAVALLLILAGAAAGFMMASAKAGREAPGSRYLLVVYESPAALAELPPERIRQAHERYWSWWHELDKSGHIVGGVKLQPEAALVLEKVDGLVAATREASPVAREAVAWAVVIRAGSPEEAERIAGTCPSLDIGGRVEIRRADET